ncbi:MAG: flagellar basal body rod protein FlgB [Candidatus Eisenbacteria bacterium]|nr:flagellar basal body rod protein FlgB [Candidatus Eisenbacteria bacterium]
MSNMVGRLGAPELLRAALDAAALRQRVAASNLANIRTEGYRPQRVVFEELLDRSQAAAGGLKATRPRHATGSAPGASPAVAPPRVVTDGEPLDMERQLIALQQSAMHFQALSQFVSGRYRALMEAIGPVR